MNRYVFCQGGGGMKNQRSIRRTRYATRLFFFLPLHYQPPIINNRNDIVNHMKEEM
jgi:hypothetical protein